MEQLTTDKRAMRAETALHGNAVTTSVNGQLEEAYLVEAPYAKDVSKILNTPLTSNEELQIARSCVWHDHVQGAAVLEEEALERVWGKKIAEIANIFNEMKMTELLIAINKTREEVKDGL